MVGKHPEFRIFVEGGGHKRLNDACRRGFGRFFEKYGLGIRKPRIVACGSRRFAYEDFCSAISKAKPNDVYLLLVDSESAFIAANNDGYWHHVKHRQGDNWDCPKNTTDEQLHFMVECMENWFFADQESLARYFGNGFKRDALTDVPDVETLRKTDVFDQLAVATRQLKTHKPPYDKGHDSFAILEALDPNKVVSKAPCAKRLLNEVRKISGIKQ